MRKLIFTSVSFILLGASCFAISLPLFQNSTRLLEDAQFAFDSGAYGEALKLAEEAKLLRQQEVDECLSALNQAFRPQEVQDAGDDIAIVTEVIRSRNVYDVVALIEYMVSLHGQDYFDNSIKGLLGHLTDKRMMPEATHLLARIYEYEGEYELSYSYYEDAWKNADVLDIPAEKYDILYDMANLAYNLNDYENCEKALGLIVADDPYYANEGFVKALSESIIQRGYSAHKVFNLYRTDCYRSIPAFYRLTELYVEQGRQQEAFKMSLFGVLTAFTRMNGFLEDRVMEFQFSDLESFFMRVAEDYELAEWTIDQGFWRCLYRLADLSSSFESKDFAEQLLVVMARTAPENYWRQLAVGRLY